MALQFCTACGSQVEPNSRFCPVCGGSFSKETANSQETVTQNVMTQVSTASPTLAKCIGNHVYANEGSDEIGFLQTIPTPTLDEPGPIKYLFVGFLRLIKSLPRVLKNKKRLVLLLVVLTLWLASFIMELFELVVPALKWIHFLSFAKSGSGSSAVGILGSIIGKGVFVYLLGVLFTNGNPFSGMGGGLKSFSRAFVVKDKKSLSLLLLGIGLALISYNFLTGNASLQNSMIGVLAFSVSLKALGSERSFLRGFLKSIFRKTLTGVAEKKTQVDRMLAGATVGFVLAIALSALGLRYLHYGTGLLVLIVATVLKFTTGKRRGSEAS